MQYLSNTHTFQKRFHEQQKQQTMTWRSASVFWAAQIQRLNQDGPPSAHHRRADQSKNAVVLPAFFGWHATSGLPWLGLRR